LGYFIHEIDVYFIVFFGVELYQFAIEFNQSGKVYFVLLLSVGLLLSQDGVNEFLGEAVGFLLPTVSVGFHQF